MSTQQMAEAPPRTPDDRAGRRAGSILCVVDRRAPGTGAVEAAARLAAERVVPMSLLAIATAPVLFAMDPSVHWQLRCSAEDAALQWLTRAIATVPPEVDLRVLLRHGRPQEAIAREVTASGHATVVLGAAPRRRHRWYASLVGRVSALVDAEIIVVPTAAG